MFRLLVFRGVARALRPVEPATSPAAGRLVAGLLAVPLLAACSLGGSSSPSQSSQSSTSSASPSARSSAPSSPTGNLDQVPQVAAQLEPSVVTVLVGGGNGSGVVYTADGLILTNEHVVRDQQSVQIVFGDGQRVAGAVKAMDPVTDLALVQANRKNLPPARFQSKLPTVGSLAVVMGSPLGFQNTVTAGIISGLHREIPGSAAESQALVDLIQTDAPISPGNSGGAVANAAGEVVGISEAYIPPQAGAVAIGFAIPAATALDIADQLQRSGQARHAFAGLEPEAITPQIASQLRLGTTDGMIVVGVVPNGAADQAGVRPGDIVTAVDSQPIHTPEDFIAALRQHRPGDTVTLKAHQPGQPARDVKLTLTDRPQVSR